MSVNDAASTKSLRSHWHRAVVTVLVATRRESNMTQDSLAKVLGWHRSRVAKIESGERRIDVPEFIAIANGLNIDPGRLLARVMRWS
jgi:transcriptional regulator with XRE-family HTH domain